MSDDGILIIEDVQSWDWIDILKNEVPEQIKIDMMMSFLQLTNQLFTFNFIYKKIYI